MSLVFYNLLCVCGRFLIAAVDSEEQPKAAEEQTSPNWGRGERCWPSETIQPEDDPLTPSPGKVSGSGLGHAQDCANANSAVCLSAE